MEGVSTLLIIVTIAISRLSSVASYEGYLIVKGTDNYYNCDIRGNGNVYCRQICHKFDAGDGHCQGIYSQSCWCKNLRISKHGGYPKQSNGKLYSCWKDEYCEGICKQHDAAYGYCYASSCYCE
uniref:Putative Na+ channel toxin n=1 Tax=Superstitionia donensis TaxID=311983 RepID=A0A1V1WBP7_9SCOR